MSSHSRNPMHFSQSTNPSQPNLFRVRVRDGLALASNKATQSSQSNLPSHTCHTSQSRETCKSSHHSLSILSAQPGAPSLSFRAYRYSRSSHCGKSSPPLLMLVGSLALQPG